MHNNESVIQKVKKLLALADGNKNEHEREVAMRFAMDLLSKHNLSVAQVQAQLESPEISVCSVEGAFRLERWVKTILDAVCTLYYTDYYITVRKTAMFVGTAENIAVSINVAEWLIDSVRKESNRRFKDNFQRKSFRLGASWKVLTRAIDLVVEEEFAERERTGTSGSGTSLAVVRNQLERANEEFLSQLNLRQTKIRRVYIDQKSFDSGSNYGESVALGRQTKRLPQFV